MGLAAAAGWKKLWMLVGAPVLRALGDAGFPRRCAACGNLLAAGPPAAAAPEPPAVGILRPHVCAGCLLGLMPLEPPLCTCCGVMFKGRTGEDRLCGRCIESPPAFRMARAAVVYDRSMTAMIQRFKYRGKTHLAAPLGALLGAAFDSHWAGSEVDLVLPVPLHPRRLKKRGFNQSLLLIRELRRRGAVAGAAVETDLLVRRRETASQSGLGRSERRENVSRAFDARHPEKIAGKSVLLVDDVITTGATADACARVLLENDATRVDVLAVARVI
jgi:ComF family protein